MQNKNPDVEQAAKYVQEAIQKYPNDKDALSITLGRLNFIVRKEDDNKYYSVRQAAEQIARDAQLPLTRKRDVQASDQLKGEALKLLNEGTEQRTSFRLESDSHKSIDSSKK